MFFVYHEGKTMHKIASLFMHSDLLNTLGLSFFRAVFIMKLLQLISLVHIHTDPKVRTLLERFFCIYFSL